MARARDVLRTEAADFLRAGGTISIAASGSAAGKVYAMTITGTEAACTFADGDVLAFDGGGESDTTSIGRCTALIRG